MPPLDADRNLLFGALALQFDFISRESLVAAVTAWSRDRSQPLDAILTRQGALSETRRAILEPLVREHLAAHGGDAGASLAAAGVPATVRDGLHGTVAADFEVTLAGAFGRGDPPETLSLAADDTGEGGRFRVLRPLARGGLGMVSVALDSELNREVALKAIRPERADDVESRERFTLEAEVTGRLEHPGIIPVYGLGADDVGRPYYAMRLIKGESLKEAAERLHADPNTAADARALRVLVNRFVDVCYAVAYAHSRGVIHRDIKPANVMLGPFGETLVVDWGLAKVVGRDREHSHESEATLRPDSGSRRDGTVAGSALGTPGYMSPEQAEGRTSAIGPLSDVHSLGATLYCLLTGKPPIEGDDLGEVLGRVTRGEFAPPRLINPHAPRSLEAVCLKAMSLSPADRYPSARALAEDVEHWLADEPVSAVRDPALTRLARWGRRHKSAVAAAVALLVTAVAALSVGTVLLQAANGQIQRERDGARRNFTTARRAVDDYLTRVGRNPLLREQGLHDLREELLGSALTFYQDFLRQQEDDPSVRAETAAAYERVGDIHREIGRLDLAILSYDQTMAIADALPPGPTAVTLRLRAGASRIDALTLMGRYGEGVAAFERAVATLPTGLSGATGDSRALAIKLGNAGAEAYDRSGKVDAALRVSREVLAVCEAYTRDRPDDRDALLGLITAYGLTTRKLILTSSLDESSEVGRLGRERGEAILRDHPRDLEIRVELADLLGQVVEVNRALGRLDLALSHGARSVELLEEARRENPLLFQTNLRLVNGLALLSNLAFENGEFERSRKLAGRAVEVASEVRTRSPNVARSGELLGYAQIAWGRALLVSGQPSDAVATLTKAAGLLESSDECASLLNAACALSLASGVDDPADGPSSADRRRRNAERAVALVKKAIDHGFTLPAMIRNDADFRPLQGRADFQSLIRELEQKLEVAKSDRVHP